MSKMKESKEDNAIDYPTSYPWLAYYQETMYNEYLPRVEPPEPQPTTSQEIWRGSQWDRLQQLEGRIIHTENEIKEMRAKKTKGKSKYD